MREIVATNVVASRPTARSTACANFLKKIVKTPTQRQLNNNSTKVGFDTKMTLQTTPPHPTPQKLNVRNISAVTEPILTKL